MHALEPACATYPVAQATHVLEFHAPSAALAVPAEHATHVEASESEYVPSTHCVHALEPASAT